MVCNDGTFTLTATDLANHLGCRHLTQLSRKVALGELKKPYRNDPALEVLIKRGQDHENAYVEHLRQSGKKVEDVRGKGTAATVSAMRNGADVIVQATLSEQQWTGNADILLKVDGQSRFGNWSYEIQDTKLSQNTRAATLLQLCLYTDLLSRLQDAVPNKMYVVKPGFITEAFAFADFHAYYRLIRKNFEQVMAGPALETYPEPVAHCDICRWWKQCDTRRHDDDHLSLVAGMRALHIEALHGQNIETLEAFANAETLAKPSRGNYETFLRKRSQAKVQLEGRATRSMLYQPLPEEKDRGFNRLPEPNAGDIYFDIEGDAFYPDGSLEYLLGYAYNDAEGKVVYEKLWATSRADEKKAFQKFMEFATRRWKKYPNLHIYHFAPYEPTAVKRLARVHAIFESEVDELLRGERFIDLHRVFKEALLASVERYSLKDLEKFTTYTRQVDLYDASLARKSFECALELNEVKSLPEETRDTVAKYNEDDCLATLALHTWLEQLRADQVMKGKQYQRPVLEETAPNEKVRELEIRSKAIFDSLTRNLPDNRETWTDADRAKWLLANQIDYFRREDKSAWWEYYRVHKLEHEELLDERKAITGLRFTETLPMKKRERTPTHRYTFPPQEVGISEGDKLVEVQGEDIGTVAAVSPEDHTIDIKKTGKSADIHPHAVHVFDRIDPGSLATSLMSLANEIDENGLDHNWDHRASKDLLMKRNPTLTSGAGAALLPGEDPVAGAIRIALALDRSILPIQGPPGTGKTYTGARMIIELVKAKKKVGITAISHSVIRTLCEKVYQLCRDEGYEIGFVHKVSERKTEACPDWVVEENDGKKVLAALKEGKVAGGTAWLWAGDDAVNTLDYLFIDEAGQMSLSQALAASRAAKNIILLGDPQQLEQPQRGAHPEGSDVAALTFLLEGHPTMPEGRGLFLGVTRRLHPNIAAFTSGTFYEGRLTSLPGLERQRVGGGTPFDGAGLFYVPVEHKGNQNRADEEIVVIKRIAEQLLSAGMWTDANDETRPLTADDILIVAPYNAQVAALKEMLPHVPVGTVDKFQGKEAPVVIYSMTSSTTEDAPRGMNFLFNPNRFNVATSRAKGICILVASPRLLETDCHTIDQMRWSNAVCRYLEIGMMAIPQSR